MILKVQYIFYKAQLRVKASNPSFPLKGREGNLPDEIVNHKRGTNSYGKMLRT